MSLLVFTILEIVPSKVYNLEKDSCEHSMSQLHTILSLANSQLLAAHAATCIPIGRQAVGISNLELNLQLFPAALTKRCLK
jgi:hypothetical protein